MAPCFRTTTSPWRGWLARRGEQWVAGCYRLHGTDDHRAEFGPGSATEVMRLAEQYAHETEATYRPHVAAVVYWGW